jgi:hypothetical protein
MQAYYDDMWLFDTNTSLWAWMSGTPNSIPLAPDMNLAGDIEHPCARAAANTWIDRNHDIWIYGGIFNTPGDYLADLWKLEIQYLNATWTYIGGGNVERPLDSVHSSYDGPSPFPGSRGKSATWLDADDNLYMFGGEGYSNFSPPGQGISQKSRISKNQDIARICGCSM